MANVSKTIPAGQRALVHLKSVEQSGAVVTPTIVAGPPPNPQPPNTVHVWASIHGVSMAYGGGISFAAAPGDAAGVYVQNTSPPDADTVVDLHSSFAGASGPAKSSPDAVYLTLQADPHAAKTQTILGVDDPEVIPPPAP